MQINVLASLFAYSWVTIAPGAGHRRNPPPHILGTLVRVHYPGLVQLPCHPAESPALRWEDYRLGPDADHGTKAEAVLKEFWVSFFHALN